ncbi:hypothetical protein QJQ45_020175, partial [Haematococcus lacustris]
MSLKHEVKKEQPVPLVCTKQLFEEAGRPRKIQQIQFGVQTPQEIIKCGMFHVYERTLYKMPERTPAPNGPLDRRLTLATPPAQPSPAQPSPAQPSPAQPSPAQPSPAQPSPAQPSPAQPSPAQPSPAQPSPAQPSPAQPSPAQPSPAQPSSLCQQEGQAATPAFLTARPDPDSLALTLAPPRPPSPTPPSAPFPPQGISNKTAACETCGQKLQDCAGHFGYIQLELPVFHIGYFKNTIQLLQCICKTCSHVLLPLKEKQQWLRRFRNPRVERSQRV